MGLPSNLSGRSHSSTRSTFIFVLLCLFASFYFIPVSYGPRAVLHLVPNGKEQKKENLSDWTTRVGLKGMHNASLESRLLAWEQAPIVELGDWVQHNLKVSNLDFLLFEIETDSELDLSRNDNQEC